MERRVCEGKALEEFIFDGSFLAVTIGVNFSNLDCAKL